MFGANPIRKPLKGDGDFLQVHSCFLTIQGEGPFVGRAAIFLRLGGCNLACKFCDTEFENFTLLSLEEIMHQLKLAKGSTASKLIVITGGEPLRQPIEKLCSVLLDNDFQVQIETNGTIFRQLDEQVSIVCSPKASKLGYWPIRADLLERINALKFIISTNHPYYNSVPEIGQAQHNNIPIYLQPMDEYDEDKNLQNTQLAIKLCQEYNYILSLQTHKFIGIP